MSVQQDPATKIFYYTQPSGNRSVALYATEKRASYDCLNEWWDYFVKWGTEFSGEDFRSDF